MQRTSSALRAGVSWKCMPRTVPLRTLNPHVRLDRRKVETVFRKIPGTPRSHEPTAIICVRGRIDHPCASKVGFRETHSVTILHLQPQLEYA